MRVSQGRDGRSRSVPGMSSSPPLPPVVAQAIERWNDLLACGSTATQTRDALLQGVRERGLMYGDRPISTLLRPRFIDRATWQQCARAGAWFHTTVARLMPHLASDRDMLGDLGIHGALAELVQACATSPSPLSFLRLDGFLDGEVVKFVEFNSDSPGGAAFVDGLADVYETLPLFRSFRAQTPMSRRPSLPLIRQAVVDAARRAGIRAPRVAIVDWKEVATVNEFCIIAADLQAAGIAAVVCDPREMEMRGDRLTVGGEPVDIVLKRVLVTDLASRPDDARALLDALRLGRVIALNPVAVQAVTTKSLLALFWEGRFDRVLSSRARAMWARHIPFTMRVREGFFERDGRRVDATDWIVANRLQLVLKPADAWGAEGVRLGWTCSEAEWEHAVAEALRLGDHVAQERVQIPQEPFPEADDGTLHHRLMRTELSPYTFHPRATAEILARLSGNDLMNVKTGGGVVVTYVLGDATR